MSGLWRPIVPNNALNSNRGRNLWKKFVIVREEEEVEKAERFGRMLKGRWRLKGLVDSEEGRPIAHCPSHQQKPYTVSPISVNRS